MESLPPQAEPNPLIDAAAQEGETARMIDAYIEALLDPQSAISTCQDIVMLGVPEGIARHPKAFTERFMVRLREEHQQGQAFYVTAHTEASLKLLLTHAPTPEDVAWLHVGSRRARYQDGGHRLSGHPVAEVQMHFRALPPPPGTLGPVLKVLFDSLETGRSLPENLKDRDFVTALAMVHQYRGYGEPGLGSAFNKSLMRLLTLKQYRQDLLYPTGQGRYVLDHVPMLLEHLHGYFEDRCSTPRASRLLNTHMADLRQRLDKQIQPLVEAELNRSATKPSQDPSPACEHDTL